VILRWEVSGPYAVGFSTRRGGVSEGRYASLNLGVFTGDLRERAEENRGRLCGEVGADPGRLAINHQVHGSVVRRAAAGDRGNRADGLWTDEPGTPVLALTADCLPIALARTDGDRPALAVLHAGWRGLLAGVVESGVRALGGRLAAAIGPGIGPCCYEVGPDVAEHFDGDLIKDRKLDLWSAAERALRAAGVEGVERLDLCTACNPDLFFSHRRDDGDTGRQGVIGLVA
jgi:purine-nucleoside/S-methyl-5'-thioadenosine phosphorylase / adenosine deaminase